MGRKLYYTLISFLYQKKKKKFSNHTFSIIFLLVLENILIMMAPSAVIADYDSLRANVFSFFLVFLSLLIKTFKIYEIFDQFTLFLYLVIKK